MVLNDSSIWSIDGALKGTTSPGQSKLESNIIEWIHHITQTLRQ